MTSQPYDVLTGMEPEVSIDNIAAVALADEHFHDVFLQSRDGIKVPANRTILALRSPVFRKMLMGQFSEAYSPGVKADYPVVVVKAVVDYIHTDEADILVEATTGDEDNMDDDILSNEMREEFQTLIALTAAAAYYSLPGLCIKVNECMSSYLCKFPALSCEVLEALVQQGPAISKELKEVAFSNIQYVAYEHMHVFGVNLLSCEALEMILAMKNVRSDERRLEFIISWADVDSRQDRREAAMQLMAKYVNLECIPPTILSSVVASSGLVSDEKMLETYETQADKTVSFEKRFVSSPTWKESGSHIVSNDESWLTTPLNCPGLLVGKIYRWEVEVSSISGTPCVWLGVAPSRVADCISGFGGQCLRAGGIYSLDGSIYINGEVTSHNESAKFRGNSQVTLTLNLCHGEENNGSLWVSVNDRQTIMASSNMRDNLKVGEAYMPMVSVYRAKATIMSIEEET